MPIDNTIKTKKSTWIAGGILILIFAIIIIVATSSNSGSPKQEPTTNSQTTSEQDKINAQKELSDVINLAKKAELVTSYEFSNSASVVYVGGTWYNQTVQFKKDFIAKIAILKEKITGYRHFEVRDTYSNEKVAEVTTFSGSLEVYK